MKNPSEEAELQNYGAFLKDVHDRTLPSVSFVRPFESLAVPQDAARASAFLDQFSGE